MSVPNGVDDTAAQKERGGLQGDGDGAPPDTTKSVSVESGNQSIGPQAGGEQPRDNHAANEQKRRWKLPERLKNLRCPRRILGATLAEWLMAGFTGALVVTSCLQWRLMREANDTSKTSADVAKNAVAEARETRLASERRAKEDREASDKTLGLMTQQNTTQEKAATATDKLAAAAENSANFTKQSLELQKQYAEVQLRAYVATAGAALEFKNRTLIARYQVMNSGQTPAHKFKMRSNIICESPAYKGPFELPLDYDFIGIAGSSSLGSGTVHVESIAIDLSQSEVTQYTAGQIVAWVYGEITYEDVFGKPHKTRFRFVQDRDVKTGQTILGLANDGNDSN